MKKAQSDQNRGRNNGRTATTGTTEPNRNGHKCNNVVNQGTGNNGHQNKGTSGSPARCVVGKVGEYRRAMWWGITNGNKWKDQS